MAKLLFHGAALFFSFLAVVDDSAGFGGNSFIYNVLSLFYSIPVYGTAIESLHSGNTTILAFAASVSFICGEFCRLIKNEELLRRSLVRRAKSKQ